MRPQCHAAALARLVAEAAVAVGTTSLFAERVAYAIVAYPSHARPGFVSPVAFLGIYAPVLGACVWVGRRCRTARDVAAVTFVAGVLAVLSKRLCAALGVEGFPPPPAGLAGVREALLHAVRIGGGYGVVIALSAWASARASGTDQAVR